MTACLNLTREMLTDPIDIKVNGPLDFQRAKTLADRRAGEVASDPMLLSWYERESGRFSPPVECCGDDKPAWVIYAEARGATITIDVNDEAYVFIYGDFSS